jgi:hypothetical protein
MRSSCDVQLPNNPGFGVAVGLLEDKRARETNLGENGRVELVLMRQFRLVGGRKEQSFRLRAGFCQRLCRRMRMGSSGSALRERCCG